MIKSIRVHKRSQYDQHLLMCAIAEYCDAWCFDDWDGWFQDRKEIDEHFLSIMDWTRWTRNWTGHFTQCFDHGYICFSSADCNGCSYELMNKVYYDGEDWVIYQYSNVCDPICIGLAEDLMSAIHCAICNIGSCTKNWKYKGMEDWQ